jgi:hypothetical protein
MANPIRPRDIRTLLGLVVAAGLLALAAVAISACIVEGCTVDHTRRGETSVEFRLDAERPVLVSQARIELTAESFPAILPGTLRVTSKLADVGDRASIVLIRTSTNEPIPTIDRAGETQLEVDWCETGQPCLVDVTAIVRSTAPRADVETTTTWTLAAAVAYPVGEERCGPPSGAELAVGATKPEAGGAAVVAEAMGEDAIHQADRHVTVALDGGRRDGSVATGQLVITRSEASDDRRTGPIPGLWLRVTPDDGGQPIVDGPVPDPFGDPFRSIATFPILEGCTEGEACRRGYWLQLLVYDPRGFTPVDAMPFVDWDVRAAILDPTRQARRLELTVAPQAGGLATPPALVQAGAGEPFRFDPDHERKTMVFRITVPARSVPRGMVDPARSVTAVNFLRAERDPTDAGEIWISDGHWTGDGVRDPREETSGWGGGAGFERPGTMGLPLLGCAAQTDACTATTGYVIRRYESAFSKRNAERFGVAWHWRIVGAPPAATISVEIVDGAALSSQETQLERHMPALVGWAVALVVLAVLAVLAPRWLIRRGRRR